MVYTYYIYIYYTNDHYMRTYDLAQISCKYTVLQGDKIDVFILHGTWFGDGLSAPWCSPNKPYFMFHPAFQKNSPLQKLENTTKTKKLQVSTFTKKKTVFREKGKQKLPTSKKKTLNAKKSTKKPLLFGSQKQISSAFGSPFFRGAEVSFLFLF